MQTVENDRAMFQNCLAVFRASGWWSEEQIAEYSGEVGRIMKTGPEDDRQAARDFWQSEQVIRADRRLSA